jgi:hypothetical protein
MRSPDPDDVLAWFLTTFFTALAIAAIVGLTLMIYAGCQDHTPTGYYVRDNTLWAYVPWGPDNKVGDYTEERWAEIVAQNKDLPRPRKK